MKKWEALGIKNLNDLKESEAAKKPQPLKQKSSYDINELEKIDTLDFIN